MQMERQHLCRGFLFFSSFVVDKEIHPIYLCIYNEHLCLHIANEGTTSVFTAVTKYA